MENKILEIIGKKFSGQVIGPEDQNSLSEWLQQEKNRLDYKELEKTWKITHNIHNEIKPDVEEEWERFKMLRDQKKVIKKRTFHLSRISIAATILVLIGLFIIYNRYTNDKQTIIIAEKGEREVLLPDGSVAWLNTGSKIAYDKEFAGTNRKIDLSGEAYFDVVKSNFPFEILTSHQVVTQVLGTKFNLRALANENSTELTVISGKVSFGKYSHPEKQVFKKDQQVILDNTSGDIILKEYTNENILAWKTHSLRFDNTPLDIVILDLERYFNLDITIPRSEEKLFFSGEFTKPTVNQIAQIMDITFNWEHTTTEKKLHFTMSD